MWTRSPYFRKIFISVNNPKESYTTKINIWCVVNHYSQTVLLISTKTNMIYAELKAP